MTTTPTFPRFASAPKCDPALLLEPGELLLDRPARAPISGRWLELATLIVLAAVAAVAGGYAYNRGELERRVADLERIESQRSELARIVGSDEAVQLMDADRAEEAIVRAIERTMERLR